MWKKINIVENNIEAITNKAYLIKMPNNSNYKGYKFWHTDKLIKKDGKIYKLIYNDNIDLLLTHKLIIHTLYVLSSHSFISIYHMN